MMLGEDVENNVRSAMQIYVLLTGKCNLNCKMCIRGNAKFHNMPFSGFLQILQDEYIRNSNVVITGGEPTLHPQFCDIVNLCCERSESVCVATNGTLDYYIENVRGIENLSFQVSLDGDKETHNTIRRNDCFDKIIATLENYEKHSIAYSIASTIGKENKDKIFSLIPIINKRKVLYWLVSYEMPFGKSNKNNLLQVEEWNEFCDKLLSVVHFPLHVKKIFDFGLYERFENKFPILNRCFNCGSGINKLYIYPDLTVYPCTCLVDFPLGNLKTMSIAEILSGETIKRFSSYQINKSVPCNDCKYLIYCNGGCIGMSYNLFGKLGMGDVRCPTLRKHYEHEDILF